MNDLRRAAATAIEAQRDAIVEATLADRYLRCGTYVERYGPHGQERYREDAAYHLSFLADAVGTGCPSLFTDYVGWAKVLLTQLGMPTEELVQNLRCMQRALAKVLPAELAEIACEYVDAGLKQLPHLPVELPSFIEDDDPLAPLARAYMDGLLRGDRRTASRLILEALQSGTSVQDLYLGVFQSSQYEIGRLWQMNRITVAQEHYSSAATQLVMALLYPRIFNSSKVGRTVVAASVQGDLHEIGVRVVSDFFELDGWDTSYLGANTPTSGIVETVLQRDADVLALSATMTLNVRAVSQVIEAVRAVPACRDVKILVGGYPFKVAPNLWESVGADAYAPDAGGAVSIANRLIESAATQ